MTLMKPIRDQTIAICDMDRDVLFRPTAYRIKKDPKRFKWLANFSWWLLQKLNALDVYMQEVVTWTYTSRKAEPVNEALHAALNGIMRRDERTEDYAFVMGSKEFHELTGSPEFRHMLMFETGPFGYRDSYRTRIFNVPIHVVPSLSGVAAIPRVAIEHKRGR